MAAGQPPSRSRAAGLHRRDLDQDQHGTDPRLGPQGRTPPRLRTRWTLAHAHVPCSAQDQCADRTLRRRGPINGVIFRAYVEQFLVPTLQPGDIVILDNLGSHRSGATRSAIRGAGAKLASLPPY
jgi:DDE superfamily endonuclease